MGDIDMTGDINIRQMIYHIGREIEDIRQEL